MHPNVYRPWPSTHCVQTLPTTTRHSSSHSPAHGAPLPPRALQLVLPLNHLLKAHELPLHALHLPHAVSHRLYRLPTLDRGLRPSWLLFLSPLVKPCLPSIQMSTFFLSPHLSPHPPGELPPIVQFPRAQADPLAARPLPEDRTTLSFALFLLQPSLAGDQSVCFVCLSPIYHGSSCLQSRILSPVQL
jgi:hypothetical protein